MLTRQINNHCLFNLGNYITTPGNARKKLYREYPGEEIMYFYEAVDLER